MFAIKLTQVYSVGMQLNADLYIRTDALEKKTQSGRGNIKMIKRKNNSVFVVHEMMTELRVLMRQQVQDAFRENLESLYFSRLFK